MRLSLRITSWVEAVERMRSRVTSWSGKTCKAGTHSAHRRVCPGGSFGWYGCFCTAPSVQHRIGWMSRSSLSKMQTWKRQTSWIWMLWCCAEYAVGWGPARRDGDDSFQSFRQRRELRSSVKLVSVKRMATTVLRSCRRT